MKEMFLRLAGTKNRKGLNIAMGQWISGKPEYHGYNYKSAIDAFIRKHQAIEDFFFDANTSRKLQKIDSLISEEVISRCLDMDIIVLDIHDSFIVESRYEAELRTMMIESFKECGIGSIPDIKINA